MTVQIGSELVHVEQSCSERGLLVFSVDPNFKLCTAISTVPAPRVILSTTGTWETMHRYGASNFL